MTLLDQARADLASILGDTETGFAWPVTVTDPDGRSAELVGQYNDIDQLIDVDTGVAVSGRQISVSLALSALTAAGLGVPANISRPELWPWRVDLLSPYTGAALHFKVQDARPDAVLGTVICFLEFYDPKAG
jgi:hypothetical protein